MTAEEFEIAYCKGRRVSTRSISNWLKEHSESAKDALEAGVSTENVLKIVIGSMEKTYKLLDEELERGIDFISEKERQLELKHQGEQP